MGRLVTSLRRIYILLLSMTPVIILGKNHHFSDTHNLGLTLKRQYQKEIDKRIFSFKISTSIVDIWNNKANEDRKSYSACRHCIWIMGNVKLESDTLAQWFQQSRYWREKNTIWLAKRTTVQCERKEIVPRNNQITFRFSKYMPSYPYNRGKYLPLFIALLDLDRWQHMIVYLKKAFMITAHYLTYQDLLFKRNKYRQVKWIAVLLSL